MCNKIIVALLISIILLLTAILYSINSPPCKEDEFEEEGEYLEYVFKERL